MSCGSLLMYDSTFMCSSFLAKSIWKNLSIDVTRYSESLAGPPPAGPNKATVGGLDAPATDRSRLIDHIYFLSRFIRDYCIFLLFHFVTHKILIFWVSTGIWIDLLRSH